MLKGLKKSAVYDAYFHIYNRDFLRKPVLERAIDPEKGRSLDIDDLKEFKEYRAAWQNSYENPTIENSYDYDMENEFDFNRIRPKLADLRNKKYVVVPWPYYGQYDFKRQCAPMTNPYELEMESRYEPMIADLFHLPKFDRGHMVNHYQIGYAIVRKPLCLKIPADIAEKYLKPSKFLRADASTMPLVLLKVSASIYKPFKCNQITDDYERKLRCKAEGWEKRKVKRMTLEPIKYYATVNNIVYTN